MSFATGMTLAMMADAYEDLCLSADKVCRHEPSCAELMDVVQGLQKMEVTEPSTAKPALSALLEIAHSRRQSKSRDQE